MASAGELSAPESRLGSVRPAPEIWALTAVVAIAVAWPLFVFTGSQVSYLLTAVAAAGLAAWLAIRRSRLLLFLVLGCNTSSPSSTAGCPSPPGRNPARPPGRPTIPAPAPPPFAPPRPR